MERNGVISKPKLTEDLRIIFLIAAIAVCFLSLSCKKNSTAPQVENLTRPVIWVNTSEVTFATSESGGNAEAQTIEIKNTGTNPLNYTISDDAEWLQVEPTSGSSTGEIKKHTVSINKTGLKAREEAYTATISVECEESYNNPQKVSVYLNVSKEPPPKIWVDPRNLNFNAQINGTAPTSQKFSVRNTGEGTLKYEISGNKSWIDISPRAGQCSGNTKSHTVKVIASGLGTGEHKGTLTIRDPQASNNPMTIEVTLKVSKEPLPEIWVNTKSVTFSMTDGGSDPSAKSIKIKNSGGGTLNYNLDKDAQWLSVNPNSGTSSGNEKSHTLSVNSAGLTPGNHSATVSISGNNATNSPQKVNVTLKITTTPEVPTDNKISISCSPSSAVKNTIVSIPVYIRGNQNEIKVFGLELHFDTNMFQFQSVSSGKLTSDWAAVDGNEISSGVIKVGGFAGSGEAIALGSEGKIAIIKLKVTGDSYSNGKQSELRIQTYTDAIAGMSPQPAKTTFTLQK